MQQHTVTCPGRSIVGALSLSVWLGMGTAVLFGAPARQAEPVVLNISGVVQDESGQALAGAMVSLGDASCRSDDAGRWALEVSSGMRTLVVSLDGFETVRRELNLSPGMGPVEITLPAALRLREDVVVQAVRAEERTPITKTEIGPERIQTLNRGQEMPFLLATTPAINVQSDSGIAAGYSYFNIRGITQTRLNVTLDGVPLQDPEDQALYFSNFGDFTSVVDSIQIQRGVGTSGVGSASYGGSINFANVNPADQLGLEAQLGAGSWGTGRGTVGLHSGLFGGGLALYGRFSAQTTDGFRERSDVDQRTIYFGATRQDARSLFKLFGFSGRTRTQLAYLATDTATLETNLRFNALAPEEKDRFGQDFVQAQYTRLVGSATSLTAQAYYNGAQGWFRIWDPPQENLQEYGLDGHFVGLVLGATHRTGRLGLKWGAHVNDFTRDHFMDVVGGSRAYLNTGLKNELSTFLKASYETGRLRLWGDAQVRHARFEYRGDVDLGSVSWTFFNPRGGVRFDASDRLGVYASLGVMAREPARSDMLNGEDNASLPYDLGAVEPERLLDFEAGIELRRGGLVSHANVYAMEFREEIALSGELSEIGLPVRHNAGRSHRRGVELDIAWASPSWRLTAGASLSQNRLDEWTQYYDVYDADGGWLESVPLVHSDVPPLLTPELMLNGGVDWMPHRSLEISLLGRWVDAAQLDNTGNPDLRTPAFFSLDAHATLGLSSLIGRGDPRLRVQVANLLDDDRIWPAGYSYPYFVRGADGRDSLFGTSYYYPLATRSVYVTLDVRF